MRPRPYPKYKESGMELLERIPFIWTVKRLRFCLRINPTKTETRGLDGSTLVSFVPMEAIGEYGGLRLDQTKPIEEVASGYTYFQDGDVIVAKITPCFENGKGGIAEGLENGVGFGTTELHVLRPSAHLDRCYLFYFTISHAFRNIGVAHMYGAGGQKRVPDDFIRDFRHPIPTLNEQRSIATFLDRETERIDTLIAKKERQIELLQEKRTALISHAVTKGLNPNVKMKPSGIEWLGEIPEHWEVKKLKYLSAIKYGLGQPPQEMEGGLPIIRATNVERGKINTKNLIYVDPNDIPYDRDPVLRINDIIVVRSGAYTGDSAIIPSEFDGAITGYDMVVRVTKAEPHYISYSLLSIPILKNQIDLCRLRAAQPHLNAEELGECLFFMPPSKEQEKIVKYLHEKTSKMELLKQRVLNSITKLREYRTALISAAVTGKIDVCKDMTV